MSPPAGHVAERSAFGHASHDVTEPADALARNALAEHGPEAVGPEPIDARAWLAQLARSRGSLTPDIVAATLRRCRSMQLRRAILREISARWGNTGVQQTLAAEQSQAAAEPRDERAADNAPQHAHADRTRAADRTSLAAPSAGSVAGDARIGAPSPGPTVQGADARAVPSAVPDDDRAPEVPSAVDRARVLAQLGGAHLEAIEAVLLPAYRRAAAATDTEAVRALVLQIVGGVAHVVDAQGDIARLVPQSDTSPGAARTSTAETDPFEPSAPALAALVRDSAVLDRRVAALLPRLALEVSPQMLGDQSTAGAIEDAADSRHVVVRLVSEAELVIRLLEEADHIQALVLPIDVARGASEPASEAARRDVIDRVGRWTNRPINFLFLVRVLTLRGVWQSLQGLQDLRGRSAADLERKVAAQAAETGTTADVGRWDADRVQAALSYGAFDWEITGDDAMEVFELLAEAEPRARGGLVRQLHRMGRLGRLCENLPWGLVKQLWEVVDDPDASRLLEPYWTERGGGQSLGKMLDHHWYTRPLNTFLDLATFGAKPRIDAAYDAREAGLISDDDYWNSVNKAVGRAAFVGTAMVATGGLAGEFAAGAAAGLGSTGAALIGGAAAGAMGSVSGHFVGDVYDQVLDGKQGFDSLADYGRSLAEGGLVGTVVAPLGLAAAKYLPVGARTIAQQFAATHPELTRLMDAARACGVGAATQVRTTVRAFLDSMQGGGPPGLRLAYAQGGGGPIPSAVASAPPDAEVVLTVRPLQDLNAPAPLQSSDSSGDLVEVEQVTLADQVSEAFEDASRGIGEAHRPDEGGSFASENSTLGEGAPEVDAITTRRSKRDAGVVEHEGQVHTDQHHVLPRGREYEPWFRERGMDVDEWCVDLPPSEHQAQHGGGSWQLARRVARDQPDAEWGAAIMSHLVKAESRMRALRGDPLAKLRPEEILREARLFMELRGIHAPAFRRYRR
jgi:hypothetical protein